MEYANIRNMVFFVVLFSAVMHSASADNNTSGDDVTDFHYTWGAQMRLLQLENAITRNILQGNEVIAAIKAKNASMNTTELESIIAELEALKREVSNATPESGEAGAQKFVDMKEDAIRLTAEFRKIAKSMLKPYDADTLRNRLNMVQYEELKNLSRRIEEKRIQYNSERISEFLIAIGVNDTTLLASLDKIRAGNETRKDVKDALEDAIEDLGRTRKAQIALIIEERHRKDKIFAKAAEDRIMHNQSERIRERMKERFEKAEETNVSEELIEKMHDRIERFENETEERVENFENRTEEQIERFRNKTDEKVERFTNHSEEKIDRFEDMMDRIRNRTNASEEKLQDLLNSGNLTEEEREAIEDMMERRENKSESKQQHIGDMIDRVQNKTDDQIERFRNKTEDKIDRFENRSRDRIEHFENKSGKHIDLFENKTEERIERFENKTEIFHENEDEGKNPGG